MLELSKKCDQVFPIMVPHKSSLKSVNFFLIKRVNSLSLIDAGWNNEECWNELNLVLEKNGHALKDISEIILTHHHIDHIGLVNRIVSQHPVPVYASSHSIPRLNREKDFLEMRIEFFKQLYQEMGCGQTGNDRVADLKKAASDNKKNAIQAEIRAIPDNKQLVNLEVIEVPGHAPDQLAFLDKKEKWLFSGDLVIEHISSNALVEPNEFGERLPTLTQHLESLKKCMQLDVNLVYPGHGQPIKNPNGLIMKRLERTEAKCQRLLKLIQSGISTANDIALTWYKTIYLEQFNLVMSEIIGHLDYLEANRKIEKELINGIWHYSIPNSQSSGA